MKKNLSSILATAACILVVVCLVQIADLKQQIKNLEGNISSQMSYMSNGVNNIYSNINSRLEEQASLLANNTWEYGDADYNAKTVELLCSVLPKEYTTGTKTSIIIEGTEHPMTLSKGEFTTVVDIPLFAETNNFKVIFRDNDNIRTEELGWYISSRYDFLPVVNVNFNGNTTGTLRDGVYMQRLDGVVDVDLHLKSNQDYAVESVTLVEQLDGQEIGRTDIPLDNADFFENYQNENGARPEPAQPVGTSGSFYYALNNTYEIPLGSTLILYIEVVDVNGLRYRSIIDRREINNSGERVDEGYWWMGMDASIYDAKGIALYEPTAKE